MNPLYIGLIIAGVGLLLAVVGLATRAKAGRIASAPFLKTGEAARAAGAASAQGTVGVQQALGGPCTNTPCAYFNLAVEIKVKEHHGNQTQTKWKKLFERSNGVVFGLDDGSGPVWVQTGDALDGDLEQTFSGPPPGGPGLGTLAGYMPPNTPMDPRAEILEWRATEKLIRVGAPVFVMGAAQGGQLMKPASGKLLVSTRGRDALIGSAKTKAMALLAAGGLLVAGGAVFAIAKPGVAASCGALKDEVATCGISSAVQTLDMPQPDGTKKATKIRRAELTWDVTKGGKYLLQASDPKKRHAAPTISVESQGGMPMNIDFGIDLGAGSWSTKTKTATLEPGKYNVYVFSAEDGPSDLVIEIHPITAG